MNLKSKIVATLATGFFVGKSKWMPGTLGTVVGIPVAWLFVQFGPFGFMLASFALVLVSILICQWHEDHLGHHDAGEIVLDEIAGFVVAMTWLPDTWQSYLAAFILFRFFDILKPFPIGYLDRKIQGGLGVVMDDVAAGIITNILLQVVFYQTLWLGKMWQ